MTNGDHFYLPNCAKGGEPFQYKGCGLDGIFLLNGYTRRDTNYGPAVSIEKLEELHVAIGLHLVMHRKALSPTEIRFLRKQMDLTQNELGARMKISGQQIARYEKGQSDIPGPVDGLIRFLYVLSLIPQDQREMSLARVQAALHDDVDEIHVPPAYFEATARGWNETAAATAFQ